MEKHYFPTGPYSHSAAGDLVYSHRGTIGSLTAAIGSPFPGRLGAEGPGATRKHKLFKLLPRRAGYIHVLFLSINMVCSCQININITYTAAN